MIRECLLCHHTFTGNSGVCPFCPVEFSVTIANLRARFDGGEFTPTQTEPMPYFPTDRMVAYLPAFQHGYYNEGL